MMRSKSKRIKAAWKYRSDSFTKAMHRMYKKMPLGNRVSSVGDTRTIFVGTKELGPEAEQQKFKDNRIKTSKYTLYNFLPKNLFEQFRRVANFYFLIMAILALSISSPVSPVTSVLPLAFVILVTAFKQAYEDYLRYVADKEVNLYPVTVIRNGCLQEIKAQQVKVGDIVKVVSDTEVPCDLVLLCTSDTNGKAFITTANLDGETNLKTLFCPRMLRYICVNEQLSELRARVECEQPTPDLYHFFGKIRLLQQPASSVALAAMPSGSEQFLRKVELRPSEAAQSGVKLHRRTVSFEVNELERADRAERAERVQERTASVVSERSIDEAIERHDSQNSASNTSFRRGLARRESKRSDVRRTIHASFIEHEDVEPVDDLRRASEQGLSAPLGPENLLLRGHRLKNTEFVYGCAVYTGQETKLALNSKLTSNKFSSIEKSINRFLLFFMALLVVEVILCTVLKVVIEDSSLPGEMAYYNGPDPPSRTFTSVLNDLSSFIILFNYIIPISLYVTIEMQKFLGTVFFEWDLDLYDDEMNETAICNTSDLNEELGQIEYLFTDKTGTLTENKMIFRRCTVGDKAYVETNGQLMSVSTGEGRETLTNVAVKDYPDELHRFLLAMAVCHSVQVSSDGLNNNSMDSVDTMVTHHLTYQASSPDEKALVEASTRLGVAFLGERDDEILVSVSGQHHTFTTLDCLEFTSDRKRMSVIVEDANHVVWLYCKGAESHVLPLVVAGNVQRTEAAVGEYAMRGLRAMVIGYRRMSKPEYDKLAAVVDAARQELGASREQSITAAYDQLEQGLTILGATGVEDKLQDGVAETLECMRAAGIKVWILTGDKVETAVNISFSCGHFKSGTKLLYLTEKTSEADCRHAIDSLQRKVTRTGSSNFGLIVDGTSLAFALRMPEVFRELCMICTAVICCRMSPLQKCEVVQLMKNSPAKPITCAIGDGANDVSMIQEAHVGIGLMGKEGRQAVRCADFAFSRFRFLRKTFLVHGHWYYLRIATLVQYFFYKNIVFITPQFFMAFFNRYSTQPLYNSWFLMLFNVAFAELPILIYGLFEQNYPARTLLDFPYLYRNNAHDALMTWKCFFWWNSLGLWHAVAVFFLPYALMSIDDAVLLDSTPIDMWAFGTLMYHVVIVVVNLKLLSYSRFWSAFFVISIAGSVLAFVVFATSCSAIVFAPTSNDMYWVYLKLCSSPTFWLLTLLMVIVCLIPDIVFPIIYALSLRAWKRVHARRTNRSSVTFSVQEQREPESDSTRL